MLETKDNKVNEIEHNNNNNNKIARKKIYEKHEVNVGHVVMMIC